MIGMVLLSMAGGLVLWFFAGLYVKSTIEWSKALGRFDKGDAVASGVVVSVLALGGAVLFFGPLAAIWSL